MNKRDSEIKKLSDQIFGEYCYDKPDGSKVRDIGILSRLDWLEGEAPQMAKDVAQCRDEIQKFQNHVTGELELFRTEWRKDMANAHRSSESYRMQLLKAQDRIAELEKGILSATGGWGGGIYCSADLRRLAEKGHE